MKVNKLMTKEVITINNNDSVLNASILMRKFDIGLVVVTNNENIVIGVITDRDIVLRMVSKKKSNLKVDDVMTFVPICINHEASIQDAIKVMKANQVRKLIVLDDNEMLCGIISLTDISHHKDTTRLVSSLYKHITTVNKQKYHPLKYLKVDDYPL